MTMPDQAPQEDELVESILRILGITDRTSGNRPGQIQTLRQELTAQREQVKQDLLKKGGSRFSELVREQARQELLDEMEVWNSSDKRVTETVTEFINAKRKKREEI